MSIPASAAGPMPGTLSHYKTGFHTYPFFTTGSLSSTRVVVFIGGLFSGFGDVGYVNALSKAIEIIDWKLVIMHWSGAYEGFATGSLDRDVKEMADLVTHLRSTGHSTIVLMGHSTGSQGVIHYLTTTCPSPHLANSPLIGALPLPAVQGGILQATASTREFTDSGAYDLARSWAAVLPEAQLAMKTGKGEEILSDQACKVLGMRATGYRIWSLADPSGEDDYWSTDLPFEQDGIHAHPISKSFGKLPVPTLALWGGKDELGMPFDKVSPALKRWEEASRGQLETCVIDNASHAVTDDKDRAILGEMVVEWLTKHF
ncbi:hypothetical protein BCR39DRAFT_549686 [Naematelia encephala]|uniref:Alpha/Beta hydrolase protein n=1 Tax=Naematelia encephala TaxID=71784 RepID=A0A1Y2AL51_9TREE|nr:hypothetical protein BCR39DRAFT_549686 [Naematelia encephala]